MRIGIDCRLAGSANAGLGRYTSELVDALLEIASDDPQYVLFVRDLVQGEQLVAKHQKKNNWELIKLPARHYSLSEQWQAPQAFRRAQLDVLHIPHFNAPLLSHPRLVVTIHDLLWHHQRGTSVTTLPAPLYWWKYCAYRLVVARAVAQAKVIIAPSRVTAKEITKYYPSVKAKIKVIGEATTIHQLIPAPIAAAPSQPYLLYVGTQYPHKQLSVLLSTLAKTDELRLVLVSSRSAFHHRTQQQIHSLQLQERVHWFFGVTEAQLASLYQKAVALVQPSLAEGFGLTGLEALAMGTPVIASDIEIFHEVYGPHAHYFRVGDSQDLARKITQVLNTPQSAQAKTAAIDWATKLTWREVAKQTLAVYHSA